MSTEVEEEERKRTKPLLGEEKRRTDCCETDGGGAVSTDTGEVRFKDSHSFARRRQLAMQLRDSFPDRVPVIVEREARSSLPPLARKKFLAPENVTVAMFQSALREQMGSSLAPEEVIFLFVRGSFVPPPTALMCSVYETYRDEDGLLYATYGGQNTFGAH
eukprot:CAMPEP_0177628500 /NCGR_PEP_ID=MMETSP0447-20121125/165_1 /TAXON_ID=0 /ORGANISM="Stygamoeba regulata, Strain BSH-02190019" /LENGTH=160 /DNA_ID=CAMNT_0019129753 /DNA_START=47 /DNA_END=529 /DNA_ORIENTATION=+